MSEQAIRTNIVVDASKAVTDLDRLKNSFLKNAKASETLTKHISELEKVTKTLTDESVRLLKQEKRSHRKFKTKCCNRKKKT